VNITEVRIKLTDDPRSKLKAYCSITFDNDFVVRDLKVIDGARGPFVAMPSRKLSDRCPRCTAKNYLQARFCQSCGTRLPESRVGRDDQGRTRLHADLAHPINPNCRVALHTAVVRAFQEELERSKQEGYVPATFDDFDALDDSLHDDYVEDVARAARERPKVQARPGEATATEH
jgi:stage V sporulation protein G